MSLDQRETRNGVNFNSLPDDVLWFILRYCDIKSLLVLARVSRNLNRVVSNDCVWRRVSRRCINVFSSDRTSCVSWKECCRVSWNWAHGHCKDRCSIKFKPNLIPFIQLRRTHHLYVAQGPDVVLYNYRVKGGNSQLPWKLLMTFSGHHGDVTKFVVRGTQLVTASVDKSICTWNLKSGLCNGLFIGHTDDVRSVDCFGSMIVSGSRDKTVKVWSQQSQSCTHTIFFDDPIWSVSLNASISCVVSGSSGHSQDVSPLQLWDIDNGRLVRSLVSGVNRPGAGVLGMKWESPYTLLSCGYDTVVKLWDTRIGHSATPCVLKWEDPHDSVVYCIDSDNKWMVVSGTSRYGVVRVWDKRLRNCIRMFYAGRNSYSPVYSLQFNRTTLFVALANGIRTLDFTV